MVKRAILHGFALVLMMAACNQVYKQYDKESFPTFLWRSGQRIVFDPEITDTTKTYKVIVGIRHVHGIAQNSINITIRTVSPSGKAKTDKADLRIKSSDNEYTGSCAGDLCDLETVVADTVKFKEQGRYYYEITHNEDIPRIAGILEVGLIIEEDQ